MVLSRPADRPLQLHIDGSEKPNRVYSDNDVVSGVVRVDTRQKIESVSISFEGKAISRLTRIHSGTGSMYQTCEGRSTLFRYHERLFETGNSSAAAIESYATNRDGPFVSFPFRFRFPSTAQGDTARGTSLESNPNFEKNPGHPLPPSMTADVDAHHQTVHYFVEARMTTTALKIFTGSKEDKQFIRFMPSCLDPAAAQAPKLVEHAVTITPRHSRHLDILPRTSSSSSSDPASASFTIVTRAPPTTRGGIDLPILFSITHHSNPVPAPPPPLHLHGFRVALTAVDKSRVQYTGLQGGEMTARRAHDVCVAERRWRDEPDAAPPPLLEADGGEVALAALMEDGRLSVSKAVCPSFKTYGLARSYVLRVKLWIGCAGKTFEVDAAGQGHEIAVLPWPELRGEAAAPGVERELDEMVVEGAPPPYEEAVGGSGLMGGV